MAASTPVLVDAAAHTTLAALCQAVFPRAVVIAGQVRVRLACSDTDEQRSIWSAIGSLPQQRTRNRKGPIHAV